MKKFIIVIFLCLATVITYHTWYQNKTSELKIEIVILKEKLNFSNTELKECNDLHRISLEIDQLGKEYKQMRITADSVSTVINELISR